MRVIFATGTGTDANETLTALDVGDRLVSYHYLAEARKPEILAELVMLGVPRRSSNHRGSRTEEANGNASPRRRRKWSAE
jgi:hypothetical protein